MSVKRVDALGQEIDIGDEVAYIAKKYGQEDFLTKGTILHFTNKRIVVSAEPRWERENPRK